MGDDKTPHWNHRVVRKRSPSGETRWAIHEVHYDGDQVGWTVDPVDVATWSELGGPQTEAEALESLRWQLNAMLRALEAPIIEDSADGA